MFYIVGDGFSGGVENLSGLRAVFYHEEDYNNYLSTFQSYGAASVDLAYDVISQSSIERVMARLLAYDEADIAVFRTQAEAENFIGGQDKLIVPLDIGVTQTGPLNYTGTADAETVSGTTFADIVALEGGNDTYLYAENGGFDTVDGGSGFDTVKYNPYGDNLYNDPSFALTKDGDGSVTLAQDGTDIMKLSNFERIEVGGWGTYAFDLDGNAGIAYRIYQAAFDRTPDAAGLGFWIRALDAGDVSPLAMAAGFIISQEFNSKYGVPETVSNLDYIALLYRNVLDRDPDQAGFAYWSGQMDAGLGRDRVLAQFSESAENQTNVAAAIADGIFFL